MPAKKFAITGFPGWFGQAFIDDLARSGLSHELVLLVHPPEVLAVRSAVVDANVVPFDLASPESVRDKLAGVEAVVHAAGVIHVSKTSDWYDVNTCGTLALAADAKAAGVRRFVFLSSIAAAGQNPPGRDLTESDEPRPLHHYGASKLQAERGLLRLHEQGKFEVVILRPSMFYGPPVPARHTDIYRRIMRGKMPLVGNGLYRRSLVHIENLVQAARLVLDSDRASGQTYFIVDRAPYTTLEIVEAMAAALGVTPRYLKLPEVAGKISYQIDRVLAAANLYARPIHLLGEAHWHQSAVPEKAMRELGYSPTVELASGMRDAIEWCRSKGLL